MLKVFLKESSAQLTLCLWWKTQPKNWALNCGYLNSGEQELCKAMAIRRAALHISSVAMLIRRAALHISSVAMLIRRAALHTSSVAMLIRRAALHISSVKMAYLQSIRRTSTCSKSNISQRRRNR